MNKTVAVTGINGFLGRRLRAVLEQAGWTPQHMPLEARATAAAARAWLTAHRPAALVHTAGIVDVRLCHQQPLQAFEAHVMHTANVMEAMRLECAEAPILYVATDKSFGEQHDCGLETPYRPIYPYDASKACEDMLVESYRATFGLPVHLLRFPNFYGEGDLHAERLVPGVCLAAIKGEEMVVRTRLDGSFRQYIYVGDAAEIVMRTLADSLAGRPAPARSHFGPANIKSVGDVIADVEQILGVKIAVRVLNQPAESSRISLRDENEMGFPYTPWIEGLRRAVESYKGG